MDYRKSFYERYGETQLADSVSLPDAATLARQARLMQALYSRFIPKDKTAEIVDIGCGYGAIVAWLHSEGYQRAQGVDQGADMIGHAKSLGVPNLSVAGVREFLAGAYSRYDMIILRDVLEHFTKNEVMEIMALCREALREGGRLLVQVPNGSSPFCGHIRYGDFTHELAFTAGSLRQIFSVSRFRHMSFHECPPVTIGRSWMLTGFRKLAWKIASGLYKALLKVEAGSKKDMVVSLCLIGIADR